MSPELTVAVTNRPTTVSVSGTLNTREHIDELIAILNALMPMLPAKEPGPQEQPAAVAEVC